MNRTLIVLILILFFGAVFRLYKFDQPIADWHAWRQVDTSSVSRNFVNNGFDVLHPKFHDLSNVPSGVHPNPEGYRFVEFPFYNVLQAGFTKFIGILSLEEWGRVVTIFSSLSSSVFLYLILKKYLNSTAGLFAAFFYTFIPFNIYFGRVILPDPMTVSASLASIYCFGNWLERKELSVLNLQFLAVVILTSASLLLKPFAAFFFFPMVYLVYERYGFDFLKKKELWIFAVLSVLPLVFWRIWMLQYPGGIPQSGWLLNGSEIRFKGAFFQWIFADRIGRLILGYWGLPLFILGLLLKLPKKTHFFFLSFLVSSLLYLFVIATGNVQHDYYQILIMPTISIFLALGAYYLWENKSNTYRAVSFSILAVCVIFMLSFGWYNVRANYNIDHPELIRAGERIDKLIPKDAEVVVPTSGGDTTALYFMERRGWSSFEKPLPELIKRGADYLVIINPADSDLELSEKYELVEATSDFALFDLHKNP